MRERPAKPPTRRTSRARARRVPGEQPLRTPPVAPAAKRKTARTRLAEKRLRLRKETRASVSPDEITCQLCGKVYRAITYTHLRSRHDLGAVTAVVAYKRRFGLRVAGSAALNAQQRRARVAYFQRSGTHWTRKRIIDDLRRLEKSGCALSPRRLPSPLYQAIQRTMGSWATAVRRAGFDPAEHRSLQLRRAFRGTTRLRNRLQARSP